MAATCSPIPRPWRWGDPALLVERYGLDHVTIQLESRHHCADEPDHDTGRRG